MAICNNKKCSIGECDQTEGCAAYVPVVSNADRIRAMTDEELAHFLAWHWNKKDYGLEWLKRPAE